MLHGHMWSDYWIRQCGLPDHPVSIQMGKLRLAGWGGIGSGPGVLTDASSVDLFCEWHCASHPWEERRGRNCFLCCPGVEGPIGGGVGRTSPDGAAGEQCKLAKASVGNRLSGSCVLLKAETPEGCNAYPRLDFRAQGWLEEGAGARNRIWEF